MISDDHWVLSDCSQSSILSGDLTAFITVVAPAALCYTLWRIFVTNRMGPRGGVTVLGLENTSATDTELYGRRISGWTFALYFATSFLTFNLGVMAFNFYYYVTGLLSSLLD